MIKFVIDYLEIPITHRCSLNCDGCTAFGGYGLEDEVTLIDLVDYVATWSERIVPKKIRILGGEPFLNEALGDILYACRDFFPDTELELCTNGLNLSLHKDLGSVLKETDCGLFISIHSDSKEYNKRFNKSKKILKTWFDKYGVYPTLGNNIDNWSRFYLGDGDKILPFRDGDHKESHENCHSRSCLNLLEGKLYKCPQLANLKVVDKVLGLSDNNPWKEYLEYEGCSITSTDEELKAFFEKSLVAEDYCGMCPKKPRQYKKRIDANYKKRER